MSKITALALWLLAIGLLFQVVALVIRVQELHAGLPAAGLLNEDASK